MGGAKASSPPTGGAKAQISIKILRHVSGRAAQTLDLELQYRLDRAPDRLMSFADHWKDPVQLDELQASDYLHQGFKAASFKILDTHWNEKRHVLAPAEGGGYLYPRGRGVLRIRAQLRVPRGKWPLGCVWGRCAVVGAAALLPMRWDNQRRQGWPIATRYRIEWVPSQRPPGLMIHDSLHSGGAPVLAPALFWGGAWPAMRPATEFLHRGVKVNIDGALAPLNRSVHNDARWPWPRNQRGHLRELAKEAIDTALAAGLAPGVGQVLDVVVGPLRSSMAQSYSGMVLVSDRYLDTLPLRRFSKFHDAQVVRAMLDSLAMARWIGGQAPRDLSWVAGAVGASLMGSWRMQRRLRDEDMANILSPLGFLPGVDDLLYSGQSIQSSSFFRMADEPMPLRRHPLYFANQTPTGFRLYHKLKDRLGKEGFARFREMMLQRIHQDPRVLASNLAGQDLTDFFDQWLGPYPEVDYAVGEVHSQTRNGAFEHCITLHRYADGAVHESVLVRITDQKGQRIERRWTPQGPGNQTIVLKVKTGAKLANVELDPERRLLETPRVPTRAFERQFQGDPRFNNRWRPRPRFVYTGVYFSVALAEMLRAKTRKAKLRSFTGFLSWEAGLKRDLRRMFFFSLSKGRGNWLSGSAGISMQFGPKVTGNRRTYRLSIGTRGDWLTDAGLDALPGVGTTQRISLQRDTRRFRRSPQSGHRIRVSFARSDDWLWNDQKQRIHRSDWSAGASYSHYLRLAHNHVIAAQIASYASFGLSHPMFRGLVRLGGIGELSAFGADELFGRATLSLKGEYRHIFFDSLRMNLLGLAWIRDIGGVAFVGGGFVSDCDAITGFGRRSNYVGQVGYGITARYDLLGIAPQMMRIGLAIPLGRARRQCFGRAFPDELARRQGVPAHRASDLLAPFGLNISFSHDF